MNYLYNILYVVKLKDDGIFTKELTSMLNYQSTIKLDSEDFVKQLNLYIEDNWLDPETNEVVIPDDIKEGFSVLMKKKLKYFSFKPYLGDSKEINSNNVINYFLYKLFLEIQGESHLSDDDLEVILEPDGYDRSNELYGNLDSSFDVSRKKTTSSKNLLKLTDNDYWWDWNYSDLFQNLSEKNISNIYSDSDSEYIWEEVRNVYLLSCNGKFLSYELDWQPIQLRSQVQFYIPVFKCFLERSSSFAPVAALVVKKFNFPYAVKCSINVLNISLYWWLRFENLSFRRDLRKLILNSREIRSVRNRKYRFKKWTKKQRRLNRLKLIRLKSGIVTFFRLPTFAKFVVSTTSRIKKNYIRLNSPSSQHYFKNLTSIMSNSNSGTNAGAFNLMSVSEHFIKDFFYKNFSLINLNEIQNNRSNVFLNSYMYNCFFDSDSLMSVSAVDYSNYTPFAFLSGGIRQRVMTKVNNNFIPDFYKYIYHAIGNSVEFAIKKKFFLKVLSVKDLNPDVKSHIDDIFFRNRYAQIRVGRGFFLHEMLDIMYVTFLYKDLDFLIKWFIKTMYRIEVDNFKKFFSVFKQLLNKNREFFMKQNNVKGFFFDIRGKFGHAGDAMASHIHFYIGDYSKTNKSSKFDYQFEIVKTPTGSLGLTMYLYY